MNTTARLVGYLMAATLPASAALAGSHGGFHGGSVSHSSSGRSAPQMRSGYRGPGATFQRSNPGFGANNRINNFSAPNNYNRASVYGNPTSFNGNRTSFNSNRTSVNPNRTALNTNRARLNGNRTAANGSGNWNRFNQNTNRLSSSWNHANGFHGNGSNHNGNNWWHHHHGCDNSFIFFGGFPFYSAWDYGFYPSAYYPYYPYSPYYYDPYGPTSYSDPGYPIYGDGGGNPGDPAYSQSDDGRHYERGGAANGSVVSHVQEQLAQGGYYKGSIDGVKGSRTYYAIRSYQRDHNLPVTGEISDELLDAMGIR